MWQKITVTLILTSLVVREYLRHAERMSVKIISGLQNILKNSQLIIYALQLNIDPNLQHAPSAS
jgi:hypothetical protein